MRAKGHHGRISISCRLDVDSRHLKCPLRTGLVPRGSDMCARHKSTQFWTSGLFVPPMHVGSQAAGSGRLGFSTQGLGSVTRQGDPRQCVTDPTNAEQTASCFVHVIARNSNSARPYPNRQRSWAGSTVLARTSIGHATSNHRASTRTITSQTAHAHKTLTFNKAAEGAKHAACHCT